MQKEPKTLKWGSNVAKPTLGQVKFACKADVGQAPQVETVTGGGGRENNSKRKREQQPNKCLMQRSVHRGKPKPSQKPKPTNQWNKVGN